MKTIPRWILGYSLDAVGRIRVFLQSRLVIIFGIKYTYLPLKYLKTMKSWLDRYKEKRLVLYKAKDILHYPSGYTEGKSVDLLQNLGKEIVAMNTKSPMGEGHALMTENVGHLASL